MAGQFVPVNRVAEFAVIQQLVNHNVINVYHFLKPTAWDQVSMQQAATVLISAYNDHFANQQSTDLQYIIVKGRDLTSQNGIVSDTNFPPSSGGNDTATAAPSYVSFSVGHKTGLAGRSFRGRTAYGGIPAAQCYNGVVSDVYKEAWLSATQALDGLANAAGFTWGVVSRYSGYTVDPETGKKTPIPREQGIFTDIIDHSVDNRTDIQSSRKLGVGS